MAKCITKRDIVIKIADETGLRQSDVKEVVQRVLDYIIETLANGDKVELRNFGIFEPVIRKARIGRNPNNPGVEIKIPEKTVADFTPGKIMKIKMDEVRRK
jgi:nucleoid DNA-binding protein